MGLQAISDFDKKSEGEGQKEYNGVSDSKCSLAASPLEK